MREPKYGSMRKKIIFYDSDQRYTELKIRLAQDGLSQPKLFRGVVTAYLKQDPDFMNFIDKIKVSKKSGNLPKERVREERRLINDGNRALKDLLFEDGEIEDIFDILARENPDI